MIAITCICIVRVNKSCLLQIEHDEGNGAGLNLVICHVESLNADDFTTTEVQTDVLHVTTTTLPDDIPDGSNTSATSTQVVTSAADDVNLSGSSLAGSLSMEHDQTGCSDHEG